MPMIISILFYIPITIKGSDTKTTVLSFWFSYCSYYIDFFLNQKILFSSSSK
nr:MAG TPA: hypothetical protein [Caudoviricetes sp.]